MTDTLTSREDLRSFLARGAKPQQDWGVGLEVEKLIVDCNTGEAASYERIRALLAHLEGTLGWEGLYDGEFLVGLTGKKSSVTLEPGGQLELSGRLCRDIHCSQRDYDRYVGQIVTAGRPLGLCFLGLGAQPFTGLGEIGWLPKRRYGVMGPYMSRTGDMGQRMMKQTAGIQVNLDFSDEADCVRKVRLSQLLTPVFYTLFANSPILEDRPSGFLSVRGEIWSRTDPDRCGLIPQLLRVGAGFDDYIEYALDVPLYFLQRDRQLIDMTERPLTFRQYLNDGYLDFRATLSDWDLHLSTLFPEVRLRPQIEIRTADSLPQHMATSVAALAKGLLYDAEALDRVEGLFGGLSEQEFVTLYRRSWTSGLKTPFLGGQLSEAAAVLVDEARSSLRRQYAAGLSDSDESHFLDPLSGMLAGGESLAERLLKQWSGSRLDKLALLFRHCGYGPPLS
ncbi:MAG: gamma-glutamylcysteine synthetase [Desulfuromonas sp.]|nr:MAG: gamma-glutamylcysteine synthetase [Desulfuromonas sp.]